MFRDRKRTPRPGARWRPVTARGLEAPGGVPAPSRTTTTARRAGGVRRRWPLLGGLTMSVRVRRLVLLLALVAPLSLGGWWVYESPLLSVRNVSVEGTVTVSPELIEEVAGLNGQSLVRPDFDGARERLLELPMVKDARISRDLPNGARIAIVERTAWGIWQVGQQRFVIDDEGVVLDVPVPEGSPVIVQKDLLEPPRPGQTVDRGAVAVARELAASAERTVGRRAEFFEFSRADGLTAVLGAGAGLPELRATFGDSQGYEFKIAALYAVLQRAQEQERVVRSVDLRFGDRVSVLAAPKEEEATP